MTDNPYEWRSGSPASEPAAPQSRWYGVVLSACSAIVGLAFGVFALMMYAHYSLIDPQIVNRDRVIADRFLFGDGPLDLDQA